MTDRPFRAAACALLLVVGASCASSCGDSPGTQSVPPGQKPPAAARKPLRFEPEKSEHLDVAVGEEITYDLELVGDEPVDWKLVRLVTSCDCLSADYLGAPTEKRAKVRATIHGIEEEDIDGVITAEEAKDGKTRDLAEHVARIAIRRKPFVMPGEVEIEASPEGRFEIALGQAFKPDAEVPVSLLVDVGGWDDAKIEMIDAQEEPPDRDHKDVVKITRLVFQVIAEDRRAPFETKVDVEFGEPAVKRTVKVRWPGAK